MLKIKHIIWDWNGTLLDDLQVCLDSINPLLEARNLKVITPEVYKEIFTFPVIDYYRKAGFDFTKEDFEKPAKEFIDLYYAKILETRLQKYTIEVLRLFKELEIGQSIVSAMEHDALIKLIDSFEINQYFEIVQGIGDHYANGKVDIARQVLSEIDTDPENVLIVGDTLHDFEVAQQTGCNCILISHGHQSKYRLQESGCEIINDLSEIQQYVFKANSQQPTANSQQPTAKSQQPKANSQQLNSNILHYQ